MTRKTSRSALFGAVAIYLLALYFQAMDAGPLKSTRQLLSERGIALDKTSLLVALQDHDETTRGLAAQELADEHVDAAIPYIAAAFRSSTNGVVRFNLAQASLQLDYSSGESQMRLLCEDKNEKSAVRLLSIQILTSIGNHECDDDVYQLAIGAEDPQVQILALTLAPKLNAASNSSVDLFNLACSLLDDKNSAVRSAAASALGLSKNTKAIVIIRRHLASETDPNVTRELHKAYGILVSHKN